MLFLRHKDDTRDTNYFVLHKREVNNSNTYIAFLSDHEIPQSWKQFSDIYLLFDNIQDKWGLCNGVGCFFFFPLLFNGLVTVRSLQCIWYMISAVACMSSEGYQIDSVCNWRCTQTLPAWISVHVCAVLEFIYWEGTRDIYLPKTSVLMGTLGWECSKCSTAEQHTVTHRLIICKDFCSSCLAPDCMKFIFKIT